MANSEWDKVFPLSGEVKWRKVKFKNHFGIEAASPSINCLHHLCVETFVGTAWEIVDAVISKVQVDWGCMCLGLHNECILNCIILIIN